ncbi:unnamed protein product [Caenorhabditis bovis]|uniref:DUF281 domain-containing protein n=1 Tax=Caenorhabditis bovis TaxID=2654633 RepID=A0A8S1F3C5_9PELO|nr:unnamed protein product [Caenorhabditis bovis]
MAFVIKFVVLIFIIPLTEPKRCYDCAPVARSVNNNCVCGNFQVGGPFDLNQAYFSQTRESCHAQLICNGAPNMIVGAHKKNGDTYGLANHRWVYLEPTCRDFFIDFGIRCNYTSQQWLITKIPVNTVRYEKTGVIEDFVLPIQLTYLACSTN